MQLRLSGGRCLCAVATVGVVLLASATAGGVASAKPVARAASACSANYGYVSPYSLHVEATDVQYVACKMALLVGRAFFYRTATLTTPNFPPPSGNGPPGGRSKPYELKTPLGYMRCVMDERGSDFIDGDCHRFNVSMHLYLHRDCCRAADVSSADRSARLASGPRPPGRQIGYAYCDHNQRNCVGGLSSGRGPARHWRKAPHGYDRRWRCNWWAAGWSESLGEWKNFCIRRPR